MRRAVIGVLLVIALMSSATPGWCWDEDQGLNAIGVRMGFPATYRHVAFHQYELYASFGLPWSIRNSDGWGIAMQANIAAGALYGAGTTGFIGALGPGIIFDKAGGKGVAIELGGDLNGLTEDHFGGVDLNGVCLFDGHIGILYRFDGGPGVGYRFQHTSNAGLNGNINTGFDLHMFSVNWNFQ